MAKRKASSRDLPHYVYLIASEVGLVKIGYSRNVSRRLVQMRADSGCEIVLAHSWAFATMTPAVEHEAAMHTLLKWSHVRGEWHRISVDAAIETGNALLSGDARGVTALVARHRAEMPPTIGTDLEQAV